MSPRIIEVLISPTGQIKVQTKGYAGSDCQQDGEAEDQSLLLHVFLFSNDGAGRRRATVPLATNRTFPRALRFQAPRAFTTRGFNKLRKDVCELNERIEKQGK